MTDFDPSAYGITIRRKAVEDHMYFVGTVAELPDVEVFEDSFQDAYDEIMSILVGLKGVADERGRSFPRPALPNEDFSGRVTLRIPKSMHKKASALADIEGVSLNQFLVSTIAEAVGAKAATPSKPMLVTHVISAQTAIATASLGQDSLIVVGENFPR
jgi:predicted HicB family RNase H-like nuclease